MQVDLLPGMTRRIVGPADSVTPCTNLIELKPVFERNVILLATASISDGNIFNNGLYQNCFLLYRLAEAIGWMPIFVVNSKPKSLEGIPELLRSCRIAEIEDIFLDIIDDDYSFIVYTSSYEYKIKMYKANSKIFKNGRQKNLLRFY
jgi:hypothetical protein